MRDWLMVRVREPPWYLAIGMEKYIRNGREYSLFSSFFSFFFFFFRTRTNENNIREGSENDRNRMSARRIFWWRFKPRVYEAVVRVGEHKNRPHSALASSPWRDTYPPPSSFLARRKDDWLWSLAENVGDARLRAICPAVATLPTELEFEHFQNLNGNCRNEDVRKKITRNYDYVDHDDEKTKRG